MKLCPQCEFLYEDDQSLCDMDGETLVYDTRAELLNGPGPAMVRAIRTKSQLKTIMLPVVFGLILSALLFVAYCSSSPRLYSSFASRINQPKETGQQKQFTPPSNSGSWPATTPPVKPEVVSTDTGATVDQTKPKSVQTLMAPKASSPTLISEDKRLVITTTLPAITQLSPLPRLAPPGRLPAAKPYTHTPEQKPGVANQQTTVKSQKALVVEVKPDRVKAGKRSAVGRFFKKTARILKKPFRL